jgi:CzcA family heavy metal efflux pump
MIGAIVGTSLRFRLIVVAAAALVMGLGITQLRSAPVDVLPEFTPPYIEIQTEALGLSAEEVEQLITVPLEADLLNGVEGVDVIRSKSLAGLSSIVLVFRSDFDLYRGRALVQERLTQQGAAALPNVSKPSVMLQPYSSASRVLVFGLSSDKVSPIEKSVMARWVIQPRLLGVPGVANVSIWGFRDRQLQVLVDPERLRDKGVTLQQVIETTGNAQVSTPLSFLEGSTPGTGGFIETPQQRLGVRHTLDKLTDPKTLGEVPVEGTNGRLRLADVGSVVVDHQPLTGDAVVNGGDGLLLVVEKFPGANTLEVTRGVESALDNLRAGLGGMEPDTSIFRPASFVEDVLGNLKLALLIAGGLLALMIAAFLFQWRTVLISLITIPLSLVTAGFVLHRMGETFNAILFAGLAAALIVVIDDAIAGSENIARHLRRQREAGSDRPLGDIIRQATHEVRRPLTYATMIALLAIVPVAAMGGRPGAFYASLVLAYAVAVVVAMVLALTFTPALSALLLARESARRESPIVAFLRPLYDRALARVVVRPRALMIGAAAAVAIAIAVTPLLGTSLIPSFKDTNLLVRLSAEPGTSNTRMTQIATQVSRELRALPGVSNAAAQIGRAINGDQLVDVNSANVLVSMDSGADYDATMSSIEEAVADLRGARSEVITYSEQKIRDVGALRAGDNPVTGDGLNVLTGSDKPLVVRVFGENLDVIRREAAKVRTMMSQVDGVVDPRIDEPATQPNVEIEVDIVKARQFGIKPGDVRRAATTLVSGLNVGSVFEEQKVFEVVVQGTEETRRNASDVRNLLIDAPGGRHVRLGDVADVRIDRSPIAIERDAVSRFVDVEANVSGRSLGDVASEIENRLRESVFPLEYHAAVVTHSTASEIGATKMLLAAIAALIAAFLLMQAAFMSWRIALLGMATLPIALVGGIAAALINGAELSLGALVGFLALFALAARNSVTLLRHFQDLERHGEETFGMGLIRHGMSDRFAPMLTTAAASAVVALVFGVLGSRPGLEIVSPMAWVILGGLITSMMLALFVLPTLYLRFGGGVPVMTPEEELLEEWIGVRPPQPQPEPAPEPEPVARAQARAEKKDGGEPDAHGLPSPA